jgi:signal transduction histidine kinase
MISLRLKLITMVVLTVGLALAGSWVFFSLAANARMDSLNDRSLSDQVADIEKAISWKDNKVHVNLPVKLERDYRAGAGQFVYVISDEQGSIIQSFGGSSLLRETKSAAAEGGNRLSIFSTIRSLSGESVKFFAAEKWLKLGPDHWVNIQVAQGPLHDDVLADEILFEMFESYGLMIVVLIATLIAGIIFVVNQLTFSLRKLEKEAINIRPGAKGQALKVEHVPSELLPLVAQVNDALKRLNEAYVLQRNFSDMAAHELRSPLAIVQCQAELLPNSDEKTRLLDDIATMEIVLNRLLQLSHSQSAVLEPDQTVELGAVLGDILSDVGALYIRRGMQLTFNRLSIPVKVHADKAMLEVIIRNLLDNAQAAGGGTVCVTISYDEKGLLKLVDNGPGVPLDQQQNIFERFYRGDGSRSNGSAGLGLAIVRSLCEAQDAQVSAHSIASGGLEIRISFLKKV